MALGGTAMTVKFGGLAFVLVALPFAFVEAKRHWKTMGRRPAAACALGAVLLVAMAVPPYAVAYVKTRNPLFPFLNARFPSPLLPKAFEVTDPRFQEKLTAGTLYDLTFRTGAYYEGQNGSLGFQWLALVPLGLLGFAVARRRPAVSAAAAGFGAAALILVAQPNVRYLYAAMPLALIPAGATFAWAAANQRAIYRGLIAFLLAATAMNAYFLPSASYYHKDFTMRQPFSRAARERYLNEAAPIRKVTSYFNQAHAGKPVLFTDEAGIAGTDGDIYENHWHQTPNQLRIQDAAGLPAMLRLMNSWTVRYFVARKPALEDVTSPPALAEFLAECTLPEFEVGDYYLARLTPDCDAKRIAEPAIVVHPGYYDDNDPALLYRGAWTHAGPVHGPDRDTSARADSPGAEVAMAFDGKGLYYIFAKGPDHGIASVTIDGVAREPIDMYAPRVQWQHKIGYCCFAPGRHAIAIRSSGAKNPAATGYAVNLDSFSVVD
jgi:hypothetical protein